MLRQRLFRIALALLAALTVGMAAAPVIARAETGRELAQAENEPFSWWMESRYELGWQLYDKVSHTYPNEYVNPDGWATGFDACESPLAEGMLAPVYSWTVNGVDNDFSFEAGPTTECRLTTETDPALPLLPAQGEYDVTLLVESARSEPATASQTIKIRDLLIVLIGDSNASGEGNPHTNQVGGLRPVDGKWFEPRCHRSAWSGHARAAAAIEANDPHTSVTFLSFACSGGKIWEGLIDSYYGIQQPDGLVLPLEPQLIQLMEHLCDTEVTDGNPTCIENPREIDSLFLSIGVNDIGFTPLLMSCAKEKKIKNIRAGDLWIPGIIDVLTQWDWDQIMDNPIDYLAGPYDEYILELFGGLFDLFGSNAFACQGALEPIVDMNLAALWSHFDLLGEMLDGNTAQVAADIAADESNYGWMQGSVRTKFLNHYGDLPFEMAQSIEPDEVYITSYPVDPFRDENLNPTGCGALFGINGGDALWLNEQGERLNQHLAWEAEKHQWHFVDGITAAFEGHGYCTGDDSYYRDVTESLLSQQNPDGTLHPNADGHTVTRDHLLDVYHSEKPDFSEKHSATFDIEAVRVSGGDFAGGTTEFTAKIYDQWYRHEHMIDETQISTGGWHTLPENSFAFHDQLADDDEITVLAHTQAGGGRFEGPTCRPPECVEVLPTVKLRVERVFTVDNNWGADYDWCESEPANTFTTQHTCILETSSGGYTFEVRLQVTVVNNPASPYHSGYDAGDREVCGEFGDCSDGPTATTASGPVPSSLVEYVDFLASQGVDVAMITAIVDYIVNQDGQQVVQ